MGRDGDPGGLTTFSKDPKMQAAKIRLLDGTSKEFELHRGSNGEALFALVSADLSIEEREYFSLCFYDCEGTRHWLYNDKKILRQLKGLPWEFCFEVKFYPTTPSSLNGDHARYNLFLQLRNDVCTGKLPATMDTLATLGSLAAQAEFGDAKSTSDYEQYLRSTRFAPQNSEQLIEMIAMKHKDHKGLTPTEAQNLYMDKCKEQSMYGIFVFNAKDNKSVPVGIGICAHGIYIYKEQIRVNRFPWQGIIKISYRKSQFAIKLKPGEIDKKETTAVYKVVDYQHAKRIWKCAVEHHTFFRLIQPDEKPRSSLFRLGSARFRYQGRTQFQTKMASQMFDKSSAEATLQRDSNARLTHSLDNVAREQVIGGQVSPLHYADNELGSQEPMASPTACYDVSGQSEKRKLTDKSSSKKPKKQKKVAIDSSDSSSSSEDEKNQVHVVPVESGGVTLPFYMDPEEKDGRVLRRETNELKYHIRGEGIPPEFDPKDPSLASVIAEAERLNQRVPRLEHSERTVTVRALAPLPLSYKESGQPHTTISTWQESSRIPDEVKTEYDEKGNKIKKTLKTSQVKQTVQKQTFQNYVIPPGGESGVVTVEHVREETTPLGLSIASTNGSVGTLPHVVQTHTRSVAYDASPDDEHHEDLGEFVSCKTLTSGNRTVETYTYKTERDGIIETHVEHRVTIHSDEPIDHDAELSQAIMEATQMNPDMTVEKIEVRQESTA